MWLCESKILLVQLIYTDQNDCLGKYNDSANKNVWDQFYWTEIDSWGLYNKKEKQFIQISLKTSTPLTKFLYKKFNFTY